MEQVFGLFAERFSQEFLIQGPDIRILMGFANSFIAFSIKFLVSLMYVTSEEVVLIK